MVDTRVIALVGTVGWILTVERHPSALASGVIGDRRRQSLLVALRNPIFAVRPIAACVIDAVAEMILECRIKGHKATFQSDQR